MQSACMGIGSSFATVSWVKRPVSQMNGSVMLQAVLMKVQDESRDVCQLDQGSAQKDCTAGKRVHFSSY